MKKFKNEFGVVSQSKALLTAFKEEVEKLGWIYDEEFLPWNRLPNYDCLYFADHNDTGASLKPNHFSLSNKDKNTYYLPQQYEEALKAASEVVEEIPEYVEYINKNFNQNILKVDEWTSHAYFKSTLNNGEKVEPFKHLVKLSTKEAYDAQNNPVFKVGDWVVVTCSDGSISRRWSNGEASIGHTFQLVVGKCTYSIPYKRQIEKLNSGEDDILCPDNRFGINYEKRWLRLATPEEIAEVTKPKFKVGDWIKRTWNDGDIDTFKIEGINPPNYRHSYFTRSTYKGLLKEGLCQISDDRFTDELIPAPKSFSDKVTLTLGTSNIKITVYKDGRVEAEGREGTIKQVKQFIDSMVWKRSELGWYISYPLIQIGCSKFTLKELQKIVTTYDELNS